MVNPYAADQCARSLALALEMPADEQVRRMRDMRDVVSGTDSTWWGEQVLHDAITSRIYSARAERATA
jgi:trehalose-6-phosphate synthase